MKKSTLIMVIVVFLLITLGGILIVRKKRASRQQPSLILDTSGKVVKTIKTLTDNGGRVDWSPKGDLIAFDRKGEDGYYDVWVMKPDGSEQRCLTCNHPQLTKHNGTPSWHPSGDYIVFQGQNPNLQFPGVRMKLMGDFLASPGGGLHNNLWVVDKEGKNFWQLTFVEAGGGILHSRFSNDGKMLAWTERLTLKPKGETSSDVIGEWQIVIADFTLEGGKPSVSNLRKIKPGDFQLYEMGNFTPDDKTITYTVLKRGTPLSSLDIAIHNLENQQYRLLTDTPYEWDEFPQITPDGEKIIWVSSMEIDQKRDSQGYIDLQSFKLDFWQMNIDGSGKERLTYFNEPGASEYVPEGIVTSNLSFSPDGKSFVTKIRKTGKDPLKQEIIVLIELE